MKGKDNPSKKGEQEEQKEGKKGKEMHTEPTRVESSRMEALQMASTKTWMGFFSVIRWMISNVCLTMLNTKKNNKHMNKEKKNKSPLLTFESKENIFLVCND